MHELNHEMFGSVTHIIAKVSKHMIGVSKHMFGNVTYYEKLVETLIKKYCECLPRNIYEKTQSNLHIPFSGKTV